LQKLEATELLGDNNGLLLLGDNIPVVEFLNRSLHEKIRCIYMDPPYRNGEVYEHYSDAETHEQWVKSMAALLPRVWSLVSDDGSVWISIDDAEMAYLKILCDTTFGRNSFVATVVWEHRTTRENRASFSHNHEYILVYAKDPALFRKTRNKIPAPEVANRYKNPDNDPRGAWQSVTATAQAGHAVPSQYYCIESPTTGKKHYPPKGRCWIYNEERMKREIREGNIYFGADGNAVPRVKKFPTDSVPSLVPSTLWSADEVGTATAAKKQLLHLFPDATEGVFETPKPESLLARILSIATKPGDLVLDPYLGSGTTAASAHKMGRRYIGIDVSTLSFEFSCKRLDRVVAGERSGISRECAWRGGGTYRAINLSSLGRETPPSE
jgi:adenine-specific DNA-methyltransferase